jgi:uncharacterized protein (TIGR02996 family)
VEAVEQDLLDAIARDPEDPAPYLVYADWLQSRGALRGELMTLQNATDDRPGDHRISDAALDHIRAHAAYYLGELAQFVDEPDYLRFGWRCGFIGSAELTWNRRWRGGLLWTPVDMSPVNVLGALLQLPSARYLTRLLVEPTHEVDATFVGETLVSYVPATLRQLHLGPRDEYSAMRDCELGALDELWDRVPELRELVVHGDLSTLGTLDLPKLRSARIQIDPTGERRSDVLFEVARGRWPCIERLQVASPGDPRAIDELLARTDLVVLGDLGLVNCDFGDALAAQIAKAPLTPQIHRLSLAKGNLTDAGVATLVRHREQFESLAMIDVSETLVTADGAGRLRSLAPEVIARDLRTGSGVAIRPLPEDDE